MRETDVDAVMAIELTSYAFPWEHQTFHDCLHAGYSCWIREAGTPKEIDAYGILMAGLGEAHILNMCVHPVRRGHGVGRSVLRHLLDRAARIRAERIFLEVRPSNTAAYCLYTQAGFVPVGRRKGYYPAVDGREDAIVMVLALPGSRITDLASGLDLDETIA
jgi:ribosomal-protein-alanine N-acetyltransferase